jgi:AraC family transcriptional regulator of adaptative response / DNA-3-methyladenine glycosylase II
LSGRVAEARECALFPLRSRRRGTRIPTLPALPAGSLAGHAGVARQFRDGFPRAWDGFELAVRAVLGQQVTVKGATTLAGRLAAAFGERSEHGLLFPTAEALADADTTRIGLTRARMQTLRELARAVCRGAISFEGARGLDSFVEEFTAIPGIGAWTAQNVAMRALGEPDAFPASDLGLLRAIAGGGGTITAKALEERANAWRPWRAYAAMHLWMTSTDDGISENRKSDARRRTA